MDHMTGSRWVRGHWAIENNLHSGRDVTFAEDRSRIRTGHAPQLLAACRNVALTLIHRSGSSQIAASRRSFSYHPRRAFDLLFSRASPQQSFTDPVSLASRTRIPLRKAL